jgi:hypothetical protein
MLGTTAGSTRRSDSSVSGDNELVSLPDFCFVYFPLCLSDFHGQCRIAVLGSNGWTCHLLGVLV